MIDVTVPEAIRSIKPDYTYTRELRCPVCGGRASYRSYDKEHEAFAFHCIYCGHDAKITWPALAVLRSEGEVKFDENGDPIIPEGFEVPDFPDDPNNVAYEIFDIMKDAEAGTGGDTTPKNSFSVVVSSGSDLSINGVDADDFTVNRGQSAVFTVAVTADDKAFDVTSSGLDKTKIHLEINGTNYTAETAPSNIKCNYASGTGKITLTVSNVTIDYNITVSADLIDDI